MTAGELLAILEAPDFVQELGEMSTYLASITQERPIQYLFAKHFCKQGRDYELEHKRYDLTVDGRHIEMKFNYDRCQEVLGAELVACKGNVDLLFLPRADNWGVGHRIGKDLRDKKPDFFIWIVCARDLTAIPADKLCRINMCTEQMKYAVTNPFNPTDESLRVIDTFLCLMCVRQESTRPFTIHKHRIHTNGIFPSVYHFRICDFTSQAIAR